MIPVSVYRQIRGYAVAPEDIQIGDGDSLEVALSLGGAITKVPISRKTATVTIRGLTEAQSQALVREAQNNVTALLRGRANTENLNLGAITIEQAVLVKAVPSIPIEVAGQRLIETTQLEFQSQRFT